MPKNQKKTKPLPRAKPLPPKKSTPMSKMASLPPRERISPRRAAFEANRYYNELTGLQQTATVEEIELSEDGELWLVTLGVLKELPAFGPREYKLFKVDAYTGDVHSMKMRRV